MSGDTELALATVALNGGQFDEAERRFTHLVERGNLPAAWVGLAVAKMGKAITGRAEVAEAGACFDIARRECPTDRDRLLVEDKAAQCGVGLVVKLCEQRMAAAAAAGQAQDTALAALATGGLSIATGTSSRSLFGGVASYDVFARSLNAVGNSVRDDRNARASIADLDRRIDAAASFLRTFVSPAAGSYAETGAFLAELDARIQAKPAPTPQAAERTAVGAVPAGEMIKRIEIEERA